MSKGIRKTGDIAPLGVRMQPDLKDALSDAARKNGRSLNAEIVLRLQQSFEAQVAGNGAGELMAAERMAGYAGTRRLTELEESLLDVFGRMPPEKRWALILVLK